LVREVRTGKKYALKSLKRLDEKGSRDKKIAGEINMQWQLRHPNIVKLVDFGKTDDEVFMLMEYVEGVELSGAIKDIDNNKKVTLIGQIISVLRYMHKMGCYDMDLKSDNIHIDQLHSVIKKYDFGYSIQKSKDHKSGIGEYRYGRIFGTRELLPPEFWDRLDGIRPHDLDAFDSFLLGILMAELYLGKTLESFLPLNTDDSQKAKQYHDIAIAQLDNKNPYKKLIIRLLDFFFDKGV